MSIEVSQMSRDELREIKRQKIQNNNLEERQLITIPANPAKSIVDESVDKKVCAYCRVSTDDPAQTTSYELQKKHYEEQISKTPGWTFAGIYADEGISATSLKNRDEFNRMIEDCYAGKIDVILTKNVSRFARNVVDCLSVVRKLAQLNPPVGVKFETEGFFSLDNTSEMILTVLAAAAQEESKTKSNSMNWSLEQRFDNGNFLTPVLLGFDHDEDGKLVINPDEAFTVRMIFYLFLYGFPLSEIAEMLTDLKRPTKKGNTRWSAPVVRSILKNERHCGNVLSWKTYTYDFWEHKKRKNNKNRKQVLEIGHHEAIISQEIFDAAQAKLQSDKYARERHPLPTLDVIDSGALKGYVSVNRTWCGFSAKDYQEASESVYEDVGINIHCKTQNDPSFATCDQDEEISGDHEQIGLDQYEIVRANFFSLKEKPVMTIRNNRIVFNTMCMNKFFDVEYVELLLNPVEKCIAIRPCSPDSPNAIRWGRKKDGRWIPSQRTISGFAGALCSVTGWNPDNRYKLCGQYLTDGQDQMLVFDLSEPEIIRLVDTGEYVNEPVGNSEKKDEKVTVSTIAPESDSDQTDIVVIYKLEKSYPEEWNGHFGKKCINHSLRSFERIHYHGNWEILRPAKMFSSGGGVRKEILHEIELEAQKMLQNLGCAV